MNRANISDIYKLTAIQEGMLFHYLGNPESGIYMEQFTQRIPLTMDRDYWNMAWNRVIAHHDILRTGFFWEGLEKPMQVVYRNCEVGIEVSDWTGLPEQEVEIRLEALCKSDRQQPFDMGKAPLMRLRVVYTGADASILVWTYHHILLDGWSAFIVLDQAVHACKALIAGQEFQLPASPPYKLYVRWLQQRDPSEAEPFLRNYLSGFAAPTPLGLVEQPSETGDGGYAIIRRSFGDRRADALRRFARDARLTLSTVIQGGYAYLLGLYSGEDNVVFGCTVSGRPASLDQSENMVGLFINTLPLRVVIRPAQAVGDWLLDIQNNLMSLRDFEHTPLVEMQGYSQVERGYPLFNSMLAVESFPYSEVVQLPEVTVTQKTNYPLTLVIEPVESINIRAMFDPRRHEPSVIERFLEHLETVIDGLTEDAARPLGLVSALSAAELARQLAWGDPELPLSDNYDLAHLFAQQAAQTPDRLAVIADGQSLRYLELDIRSNRLAHFLLSRGVQPGGEVALMLNPSTDLIVAILAVVKVGNAYAPLDPKTPSARTIGMLKDLRINHLLTHQGFAANLDLPGLQVLDLDGDATDWECCPPGSPDVERCTNRLFYVIHTSGSTGKPKAAGVYHYSFLHFIRWWNQAFGFGTEDKCLLINKITFDLAQKNVWGALLTGGELHLATSSHFDPESVREIVREQGITWINCTPSMGYALFEGDNQAARDLASLRYLFLGGEQVNKSRLAPWMLSELTRCELVNTYGPTECTDLCTTHRFSRDEFEDMGRPVTVGRALPNIRMYILDRFANLLPTGIAGEVMIGGVSLGVGYLNNRALTATQFIPHPQPVTVGERIYRTGDLGYFQDDGSIVVKGRVDFQVKVRGYRIELEEIDTVLRQHPSVHDAVTIVAGGGNQQLVSYVVAEDVGTVDRLALRESLHTYLAAHLPDYMVPSAYVLLDVIPLNVNGKVDRSALPMAEAGDGIQGDAFLPPRNDVEEKLLAIWAKVLERDGISVNDNFFALGGHSLSITQVFSRIPKVFGVKIGLGELFEFPSIAAQAALISSRQRENASHQPLVPQQRPEFLPLSHGQSRLWFIQQYAPDSPAYNVPNAVFFSDGLDVPSLRSALEQLVQRHESLRTRFPIRSGMPYQEVLDSFQPPLKIEDLSAYPEPERQTRIAEAATAQARTPFVLEQTPPIRFHLLLDESGSVLLVTMHHIITDGWSMDIFVRELRAAHQALLSGGRAELPELPIQYGDFTIWQQAYLMGELRDRQLAFWRGHLDGALHTINLPYDFSRPDQLSWEGGIIRHDLALTLARDLHSLGEKHGATMFMTLMAAFELLLYRWSGQDDFVIGTPIACRHFHELESIIGFFVNTLPLRARLDNDQSFAELLGEVKKSAQNAYDHQDLPFELLVDELKPPRSAAYNPFFQVGFAFQSSFEDLSLIDTEHWVARWDLYVTFSEREGILTGQWEYNRGIFRRETINRLAESFAVLLPQLTTDPNRRLGDYALMGRKGSDDVLRFGQGPALDLGGKLFLDHFSQWVAEHPHRTAVTFQDDFLDYAELDRRANRLANFLRRAGVGREMCVSLLLERSPDWVVALLAVIKAGGAYVPLDPSYPANRLQFMLEDSGSRWVITHSHLLNALDLPTGIRVFVIDGSHLQQALASEPEYPPPGVAIAPTDLCYVIYTSGSTGQPKGSLIEHRNLVSVVAALAERFAFTADSRMLQFASFSFDASVWEWGTALLQGGQLCMALDNVIKSPESLSAFIASAGTTHALLPPSLLGYLDHGKLACLDHMLVGGESFQQALAEAWSPCRHFFNVYGPTETTVIAVASDYRSGNAKLALGKPVANTELYVVDAGLRTVPVGVPGELCIGGAGVGRGYLNRLELTAEKFIRNPFHPDSEDRIYRTGDLVRWLPDGELEFLGRIDNQVKIRSFRIELGEIEARLMEHPDVRDAVVIARDLAPDNRQLVGYVIRKSRLEEGADDLPAALIQRLRESLPHFMVPMAIMVLDQWPMGPSGKIDRRALPLPNPDRSADSAYEPPRTELEECLVRLWQELLSIERIGVTDDFFALGGHSLSATQLVAKVREQYGRTVPLKIFFIAPTIRNMAAYLETPIDQIEDQGAELEFIALDRAVDLDRESAISITTPIGPVEPHLRHVLLTGATGFVGAYLLDEMLERWPGVTIHCLLRVKSKKEGMARVRANLEYYGLWWDGHASRIKICSGDLALPGLGLDTADREFLAAEIDLIVHNASQINHIATYSQLKATNVGSTKALLDLATRGKLKRFAYVSTAGVFNPAKPGRKTVDERSELNEEGHTEKEGYNATKWVSEQAIRNAGELGLPYQIFRLGRVVVDSNTGAGRTDDFLGLYLRTCILLRGYPNYPLVEPAVPVDFVARAIVALASHPEGSEVFHLMGRETYDWSKLLPRYVARSVGLKRWRIDQWSDRVKQMSAEHPLPFAPYLFYVDTDRGKPDLGNIKVEEKATIRRLEAMGLKMPRIENDAWKAYIQRLFEAEGVKVLFRRFGWF